MYRNNNNNGTFSIGNTGANCTIGSTESGTSGQTLRVGTNNNGYLRYSNSTWNTNSSGNAGRILFSVKKKTYDADITNAEIGGPTLISNTGISAGTFTVTSNAIIRNGYIDYVFYNNAHHYRNAANTSNLNAAPTAQTITSGYTWTLTGIDATYAEINSSTGVINYKNYVPADLTAIVQLYVGETLVGTKSVTFEAAKIDPTGITITSNNPTTVYVGQTGTIAYTLTPSPCYDNVTYTSNNTSIATVNSSGVVTGVAVGQTSIIVSAYTIGGTTTSDLTKTVTVNVRNKVSTPVISFAQIGDGATATTSITCASSGATIYYKINDAASYSTYTEPFVVDEYDEVRAYAAMVGNANWDDSEVAEATYVSCATPSPVITFTTSTSGSTTTATVTITAETGATIYYTRGNNPDDPTINVHDGTGTTTATITGVTNGQVVKAFAKNSTCSSSNIVTENIMFSGVSSDGVVTLYDYEDHSWSYYSDGSTPAYLHSLSPADVKITYYGDGIMMTGSTDYTDESTDYITSTHTDYKVGAKVNVGGENENTFVYYKTLERGDATDAAWTFSATNQSSAASRCPYTPIPNPFQVRPRYGDRTVNGTTIDANDFTGWRGFQCWRLKSVTGGAVYSAASDGNALSTGAVINAETEIYFAPNAEYGMEVELEAVWARAYVKKANQANENPVGTNNVGYERNFCVPTTGAGYTLYTGDGKRITNANHIPVTISCYYPDGTAPDNTANSISNTATSLTGDTKFENISINLTSNTLTLANYDIIIGRGCGTSTINTLQAINGDVGSAQNPSGLDYAMRIESGTINNFSFVRTTGCTVYGRYLVKAIMGCDYDRAKDL